MAVESIHWIAKKIKLVCDSKCMNSMININRNEAESCVCVFQIKGYNLRIKHPLFINTYTLIEITIEKADNPLSQSGQNHTADNWNFTFTYKKSLNNSIQ